MRWEQKRSGRPWVASLPGLLLLAGVLPGQAASPISWQSRGVGGGGALFAPALSPHAPSEMYLACDMSELFHTTDLGQSWSIVDFRKLQSFHGSKVQFTSDPAVLYVIDYSTIALVDHQRPMRSGDGGLSWVPLASDPTGSGAYTFLADPTSTDRLLINDWNTIHFSGDGGQSWTQIHTGLDNGAGALLAGAFFDGARIWVGTNDGVLVSTDSGANWSLTPATGIAAGEVIRSFAGARTGATIRLFALTSAAGGTWNGMEGWEHPSYRGIYSLDVGAPAWVARTSGIAAGDHPFYIAMARNDISVAWAAGGSDASVPVVYRTSDGGLSWSNTFEVNSNANIATGWSGRGGDRDWWYGECALGFEVAPLDPATAVFSDFGFAHLSQDGGASWRQTYVRPADQNPAGANTPRRRSYHGVGIEDTTSWCLTWADPDHLFACFSDIQGVRSTDGGDSWSFDYSGHSDNSMYRVVKHPTTGVLYGGTSSVHDLYQSTYLQDSRIDGGSGSVKFSSDRGMTWQMLHDFGHPVIWVALDPTTPSRLYAAVVHSTQGGIFVSSDIDRGGASSWSKLANPPRTQGHPFNIVVLSDGTLVVTYSGRRDATGFTDSSGLFVSTDGGASWSDRSHASMHWWTKDVVVDPHDPTENTWYVGVWSGWGGAANGRGGLYRSGDRGQSWTRIHDNDRVTSITIDPTSRDEAYMTTEVDGLFYTANLSAAQPAFTVDPAYPFRHPERVFFNPHDASEIWVTSFGYGLNVGTKPVAGPVSLLRDISITALLPVPSPAVATLLPLDPVADRWMSPIGPGDLDSDAGIVRDESHPLVFYGLDRAGTIRLVKNAAGRLQIWY